MIKTPKLRHFLAKYGPKLDLLGPTAIAEVEAALEFSEADELMRHARGCEKCMETLRTFPDLALFDHQLCEVGLAIARGAPKQKVIDEWCVCLMVGKHRMSEHGATAEWYETHEYVAEDLA